MLSQLKEDGITFWSPSNHFNTVFNHRKHFKNLFVISPCSVGKALLVFHLFFLVSLHQKVNATWNMLSACMEEWALPIPLIAMVSDCLR